MRANTIREVFDIRVKKDISEEFNLYNLKTNLSRGKLIAAVTLVIELLIIVSSLIFKKGIRNDKDAYYYMMYLIFVVVVAFFFIAMVKIEERPRVCPAASFITYGFSGFMLTWNMVISLLDGNIVSYVMTLMALSIIALLKPTATLIMYSMVHALYCILLFTFEVSRDDLFLSIINTTVALTVSWLAGYIVYKSRAEIFSSQKEVQEQSEKMEELNVELNKANKKLEYLSQTDGLTGIYNRRMFDEMSGCFWADCKEYARNLGMIMIDIDHFKLFNDTYGHQKGDECLKAIVDKIREVIPKGGVIARYGGEEFAILVENCSTSKLMVIAEEIRIKVEALKIPHERSTVKPYVTLSLGVHCSTEKDNTVSEFIGFADKALYKAKEGGRDRVAVL